MGVLRTCTRPRTGVSIRRTPGGARRIRSHRQHLPPRQDTAGQSQASSRWYATPFPGPGRHRARRDRGQGSCGSCGTYAHHGRQVSGDGKRPHAKDQSGPPYRRSRYARSARSIRPRVSGASLPIRARTADRSNRRKRGYIDGAPHGVRFRGRDHDRNRGRRDIRAEHYGEGAATRVVTGGRNDDHTRALATGGVLVDLATLHAPRSACRSASAKAAKTVWSSGGSARSHSSMSRTSWRATRSRIACSTH